MTTSQQALVITAWLILTALAYSLLDFPLTLWINHHLPDSLRFIADIMSGFGNTGIILTSLILGLITARYYQQDPNLIILLLRTLFLLIILALCVDLIKVTLGRARPNAYFHHQRLGFYFLQWKSKMWSFPSGHSAAITLTMVSLSRYYQKQAPVLWGFAIMVSLSRVFVAAHWLSDVMMGMLIGYGFAVYFPHHEQWKQRLSQRLLA